MWKQSFQKKPTRNIHFYQSISEGKNTVAHSKGSLSFLEKQQSPVIFFSVLAHVIWLMTMIVIASFLNNSFCLYHDNYFVLLKKEIHTLLPIYVKHTNQRVCLCYSFDVVHFFKIWALFLDPCPAPQTKCESSPW